MAKMNEAVKAQWVAALRSGEYKQVRGRLRTSDNAFCCLGVLCNLHAQAHPDIAAAQRYATEYMGSGDMPSPTVVRWAALPDQWGGNVVIGGTAAELTTHNDYGRTFNEIADAIEAQL